MEFGSSEKKTKGKKEMNNLCITGKSLSGALILAESNPQYDDRLFIEL